MLSACVALAYFIALKFEGSFTDKIYSEAAAKNKKKNLVAKAD